MDSIFKEVKTQYIENKASHYIDRICTDLLETFLVAINDCLDGVVKNSSTESIALENPTFFCVVRMSLEFLRLWKQNIHESDYPELSIKFKNFSEYNSKVLANLADPISLIAKPGSTAAVYDYTDSTVVLFFDHIVHETPDGHVESQARVDTSLKMLRGQTNSLSSESSRKLSFLNCNDVLSPPLWLLPLVHSPQYLGVLWKYSEEARKEDLLVPLEFDTEVVCCI